MTDFKSRIAERIGEKLRETRETYDQEINSLTSQVHKDVLGVLFKLGKDMREDGFDVMEIDGVTWGKVTIWLKKDQSISDVKKYVKKVSKSRKFKPASFQEDTTYKNVTWQWYTKDEPTHTFAVQVYLGKSLRCKRVETGRMVPEYKIVCEEEK